MNSAHSYSEGAEVPEDKTPSDNELIAKFMGLEKYTDSYLYRSPLTNKYTDCRDFKYDTSWDWLMPVVGKISQIHDSKFTYDVSEIKQGKWPSDNEYMEVIALPLSTPISDVYKEVVKFIKWYNLESLKNKPI